MKENKAPKGTAGEARDKDAALRWDTLSEGVLLHHPIMDLMEKKERAANGLTGRYVSIHTKNWVLAVPVRDGKFVMVRQWRHGMEGITVEFPGGVMEPGETPEEGAARELLEETGYRAGKVQVLGVCNPNPAIYNNTITFVLAEELTATNELHTDEDEFVEPVEIPVETVLSKLGTGEFCNAFVGTGLALYLAHERLKNQ
ncbi:MAG: NUDIX hydrolase [Lachnospiraceae bacterium]|nr:NUDIX hydrolase [Lachnospiraceae bacterium]